jgi:DNA-binding MurR/RpiR family transcriptional regulator
VLVLTVGEAHPWQEHELSFGEERYWAQLTDGGDVFYADAAATRPLRRDVVVLVVNEGRSERVAAAARKALERAAKLLVVCGETDTVAPLFA